MDHPSHPESSEQQPIFEPLELEMPPKVRAPRSTSRSRRVVSTPSTPVMAGPSPSRSASKSVAKSASKSASKARKASKSPSRNRTPKTETKKTPRSASKTRQPASASRSRSRSRSRPTTASQGSSEASSSASSSVRRSRSIQRTPVEKTIEVADDDEEFIRTPKRSVRNVTQDPPTTRQRITRSQQQVFSPRETRSMSKAVKGQGCINSVCTKVRAGANYTMDKIFLAISYVWWLITYPYYFIQKKWNKWFQSHKTIKRAYPLIFGVVLLTLLALFFCPHYVHQARTCIHDHVVAPLDRARVQAVAKGSQWSKNARQWTATQWNGLMAKWNTKSTQTP